MTEKQSFVHKAADRSAVSWNSVLSGSVRGLSTGGSQLLVVPPPYCDARPTEPCCRQGEHDGETKFCPQSSRQKRCFLEFRTVRKCTRFIHRWKSTRRRPSPPAPRYPSDGSLAAGRASMTEKQGFVHKAADRSAVSWNSVLSGSVRGLSTGGSRLRVFPRLPSPSFSVPPPAPRCPSDGSPAAGRASMTEKQGFVHKAENNSAISWSSILSGSLRDLSTGGSRLRVFPLRPSPSLPPHRDARPTAALLPAGRANRP